MLEWLQWLDEDNGDAPVWYRNEIDGRVAAALGRVAGANSGELVGAEYLLGTNASAIVVDGEDVGFEALARNLADVTTACRAVASV